MSTESLIPHDVSQDVPHDVDASRYHATSSIPVLIERLNEFGIAIVDDVRNENHALDIAAGLGHIYMHRDSESNGVTRIRMVADEMHKVGNGGFGTRALFPHTDRSSMPEPPNLVMVVCALQKAHGGATTVVDGGRLYTELLRNDPDLFREMTYEKAARLDDGRDWYHGPLFEKLKDDSVGLRFRNDRFAFFSAPLAVRMADLIRSINGLTRRVTLQPGQAYILNNRSWLHGRDAFEGEREMWRILINSTFQGRIGFAAMNDTGS